MSVTAIFRYRLDVRGQVQGVGFRPFVYRLAQHHGLGGFVANNSFGAVIEIEGTTAALAAFEQNLKTQLPPLARITELRRQVLPPLSDIDFHIHASDVDAAQRPEVTPDAATCADCLRELLDPADRRNRYPFINCTNCGPRYSIIRTVPYDRPSTTMAVFRMCPPCAREYSDPADRRFHAQPNACPTCGPQMQLVVVGKEPPAPPCCSELGRGETRLQSTSADPICAAARLLRDGAIVAVKGIGGYHLACRADREDVVCRLRERKLRDGKPLAVMVPTVDTARELCRLTPADEDALRSVAAPIVLALKSAPDLLAPSIAPGCRDHGLVLPYAPVHHLLFAEGLGPLVMTSANLAGQPLTYRDDDARAHLSDVADAFLVHNREIFRPIDDSVVQTFRDEAVPIRRARGYAPRPLRLPVLPAAPRKILAVGGELKSTVCLLDGQEAILSEHVGDLTHPDTFRHFVAAVERLNELCGFAPEIVACDLHPRYLATEYAERLGLPLVRVQHHHAHIAAVMAEWGEPGPVIGLSCDGTGYGSDGAVWGCEVLRCERGSFQRLGHLDYYPLVGGDRAALETWRPAAALLRAAYGATWRNVLRAVAAGAPAGRGREQTQLPPSDDATGTLALSIAVPNEADLHTFEQQVTKGLNAPPTSSLGRLFDAASFLLGLCARNRHEAEAAMALEAAASVHPPTVEPLAYEIREIDGCLSLSALPLIRDLVARRDAGDDVGLLAARFHETLARMLAEAARRGCAQHGIVKVALSGGCFANRRLLARLVELLESAGHQALYHRHVPCGDGGIALGQAFVATWAMMSPPSG